MTTRVRSHAKINLGLAIGAIRPDGFHALTTVYQTLALHDEVSVEAAPAPRTAIRLSCDHPQVPVDSRNTGWQMAEHVLQSLGLKRKVRIRIDKRLPVQGGLGAGSANAAAVLLALERELGVQLPAAERLELAARVGSDVGLFLLGGTVLGAGRGEEVYPLPDSPSMPCIVALPAVGVPTAEAYREWDAFAANSLTPIAQTARIKGLSRSIAVAFVEPYSSGVFPEGEGLAETPLLALVRTGIENDFEQVVFRQYPFLGEIKRVLSGLPLSGGPASEETAAYAALSGSGSAVFGIYGTATAANSALQRLQDRGVPGVVTRTLSREEYWRGLWSF